MTKQPEQINAICRQNSLLFKLTQRAQFLEQLNLIFQHILPTEFSAHCQLANIENETVIIHTDNAAYASLIRFQAPNLCKTLSKELETNIKAISVKVKPSYRPHQNKQSSHTLSLSKSSASMIKQTADDIEDGPLKLALEKLAKRATKQE